MADKPEGRCWFVRCWKSGNTVVIEPGRTVVLCEFHDDVLRKAIASPGTYQVGWGMSGADQIRRRETELERLRVMRATLPDDPVDADDVDDWDAYRASDDYRATELDVQIAGLELEFDGISPIAPPTIRVSVRTR